MKYFLDCGSNLGQGFDYFKKMYGDNYQYTLFEPNIMCYNELVKKYSSLKNVEILNKAVFTENIVKTFRFDKNNVFTPGGSLIEKHNSNVKIDFEEHQVQCVDLIEIIESLYENESEIIIKMDVESAEYDILEKLIDKKTIFKVEKMYIEFHSQFMNDDDKKLFVPREQNIENFIRVNNINVNFIPWDWR